MSSGQGNRVELVLSIRPDGRKKAYVRLTADHDALEVANKVSTAYWLWRSFD